MIMKKIYSLLVMCLVSMALAAQTNPNRMLIHEKSGNTKGYLVERIDSVSFATVDGRIAADVEFKDYKTGATGDTICLSVTRTPGCEAFRITCLPMSQANMLITDEIVADYLDNYGGAQYFQDFSNAEMTGFEFSFQDNTEYALITVGYDRYGIACSPSRVTFRTPRKPLVGSPSVEWQIDEVGTDRFTMTFKPNADVAGYATVQFNAGEAEEQFNMWGPMFGFANIGDMIKAWGLINNADFTYTWKDLAPDTDYEVYIQCWDKNGTYADMIVASVRTKKLGGTGVAEMTISIGEFGGNATDGYWQWVTFTPNDNAGLHREMLIEKKAYEAEWGEEKIVEFLKTDDPMNPFWDQYGVDEDRWIVSPATDYIAFAIARNINGEWGPLAQKEFRTPDVSPLKTFRKSPAMSPRLSAGSGTVPTRQLMDMMKTAKPAAKGGVRLTQ